jgi:hypothetical protein
MAKEYIQPMQQGKKIGKEVKLFLFADDKIL